GVMPACAGCRPRRCPPTPTPWLSVPPIPTSAWSAVNISRRARPTCCGPAGPTSRWSPASASSNGGSLPPHPPAGDLRAIMRGVPGVGPHGMTGFRRMGWLFAGVGGPGPVGTPTGPPAQAPAELLAALRGGGFVIYFRHADTDHTQNDSRMTSMADCANQRNLTDAGRENSRQIGDAIRALGVPVGAVLASPMCRTVETAVLAF